MAKNSSKFPHERAAREKSPYCGEPIYKESVQAYNEWEEWVQSLTLYRFRVFLNLTVGSAADHIPHYDFPRGIAGGQPQTVRRAQVVIVVFPRPFHLPHTKHMQCQSFLMSGLPARNCPLMRLWPFTRLKCTLE